MALPHTDTFTAADYTELQDYNAGWVKYRGTFLQIIGNAVNAPGDQNIFYGWEGDGAFSADQYAQIKCTKAENDGYIGVIVRGSPVMAFSGQRMMDFIYFIITTIPPNTT
jgi:hypothetical protein